MKRTTKTYVKKDPIEHIKDRPDMYVGSILLKDMDENIADDDFHIRKKTIKISAGLIRIFVEILSNAIDNVERSKAGDQVCTTIKISINSITGETSVFNDGEIIPIEINDVEKMYNHTLIFGNLLTGSNYDDTEERLVSGRNGLGAKLSNVFSKSFMVEGNDPVSKKKIVQKWSDNMTKADDPILTKNDSNKGYTKITYIPDFKLFQLEGYTDDIIGLYLKYIVDASMLSKVKMFFNDRLVPVNNLLSYSKLYFENKEENTEQEYLYIKNKDSEVVLVSSSSFTEFQSISFVNGINTKVGGVHVDSWTEVIFRPLVEKFNKKKDKPQISIKDVKQFFWLFVNCSVPNPVFSNQEKEKLEAPKLRDLNMKITDLNKIMKWKVMNDIDEIIKSKELMVLKKSEAKKKGYNKIEGYDPANLSGSKKSFECSLIICEGLSAKTYAICGMDKGVYGKQGRDYFGCLPLRGKVLNVRNVTIATISKNVVIKDIIQALGLQFDLDYNDETNFKSLNYGKVILLTDADVDGLHIEGLILNMFHVLFPTILEREEPFLVSMKTPIVRIFKKDGDILFYDENKFNKFVANQDGASFKSKYYKGLGTTKSEDVPDTFGEKMVQYKREEGLSTMMNKVFHKNFTDDRKQWLEVYDKQNSSLISLDDSGKFTDMSISSFLNNEVIKFSHRDCARSIPNLFDGLKESQRKVLFAVKKRNLTFNKSSLKVAQLGGYVAETTNYHHGEQNLFQTIIKMANEFPGSNNIPLLYRDGQFGSRLHGGNDSASPRYIFTKMETLTPFIFREEDDLLLEKNFDDGDEVEPKFYVPIIPMILVNGCQGIGTGWSCNIPCYNPLDIIKQIKNWLDNKQVEDLVPWYRGFKGEIKKIEDKKFITYGVIEDDKKKKTTKVVELPVGMWTEKFKDFCEDLLIQKKIKKLQNFSTPYQANLLLTESEDGLLMNLNNLKLFTYLYTTNMVLFNGKEQLKKYSVIEIIETFCQKRIELYVTRKQSILKLYEQELNILQNQSRFIQMIIDNELNVMNVEEKIIISQLEEKGFDKKEDGTYTYLLRMVVRSFTKNKVIEMENSIRKIEQKFELLLNIPEKDLWINELNEFEIEYMKWLKSMDKLFAKTKKI